MIEAKAARLDSGNFGRKALDQVIGVKSQILHEQGAMIVVNPVVTMSQLHGSYGDFPQRFKHAGVELMLGRDAVEACMKRVSELML